MSNRKNLIVVCAGDESRHVGYLGEDRNFDVCVVYYGDSEGRYSDSCEHYFAEKGTKPQLIHRVLTNNPHLRSDYENFWLPDDDLEGRTEEINLLFDLFDAHDLYIAQPSLTFDSHVSFPALTSRGEGTVLTNFVEIQCPLFNSDSLAEALPCLTETVSGWGIDRLWSAKAIDAGHQVGVFDQVALRHYRPLGSGDWWASLGIDPFQELKDLKRRHGLPEIKIQRLVNGEAIQEWPHGRKHVHIDEPPVIVGGQGGSCTRAVAAVLLQTYRIYLDCDADDEWAQTLDSFCMRTEDRTRGLNQPELIANIGKEVGSTDYSLDQLSEGLRSELIERAKVCHELAAKAAKDGSAFEKTLERVGVKYCIYERWGWKEPRSIYYLPLWKKMYPGFRFIHVVRDVRTIRQKHIEGNERFHKAWFGHEWEDAQSGFESVWASVNLGAYQWAMREMPDHYHLLRVENLAAGGDTARLELNQLFNFLELDYVYRDGALSVFKPLREVELGPRSGMVGEALRAFGYPDATGSPDKAPSQPAG